MNKKRITSIALCLVLITGGTHFIQSRTDTATTAAAQEARDALASSMDTDTDDEVYTDELVVSYDEEEASDGITIYGELPEDVEIAEFEVMTEEEMAAVDWSDVEELILDSEENLAPVIEAEPTAVVDWGSKNFVNWYIEFKQTVNSKRFSVKKGQLINVTFTYRPTSNTLYAGYIDPSNRAHGFTFTNGSMTKTFLATKTGAYRIFVGNRSFKSVRITGYYRTNK